MAASRIPSAVCSPQRPPLSFRVKSLSKPRVLYNISYVDRRWSCDCQQAKQPEIPPQVLTMLEQRVAELLKEREASTRSTSRETR
jgi:hypothetical protein